MLPAAPALPGLILPFEALDALEGEEDVVNMAQRSAPCTPALALVPQGTIPGADGGWVGSQGMTGERYGGAASMARTGRWPVSWLLPPIPSTDAKLAAGQERGCLMA